ncbi:MAG: HEAT repeat domain-containing protein, partial [Chloroflexi bacterium]|nr:HEAT repeat domain-containing protein [Chloroflexota bacterium]
MRCFGLTDNRVRCAAKAANASGYCQAHQNFVESVGEIAPKGGGVSGLVEKFFTRDGRRVIPDTAKYSLPASIKNSSTPALIEKLLHSPSADLRWSAAFALRQRRDPATIEPLWDALRRDAVALVRQQCAVALGKIGTRAVLGPLIEGLWHDADPAVRQACAIALGNLGYALAAPDLANVLEREPAAFVRWDAVLALGQVGDLSFAPRLDALAKQERAQFLREAARAAIEEIRKRAEKILPPRRQDTKRVCHSELSEESCYAEFTQSRITRHLHCNART